MPIYQKPSKPSTSETYNTSERIWFAHVHAANKPEVAATLNLLADIICQDDRLVKIYGDQAYHGVFASRMKEFGIKFEKASRPESTKGFVPVAKRWVVERSIAWTNFFRRIVKDYEYTAYRFGKSMISALTIFSFVLKTKVSL